MKCPGDGRGSSAVKQEPGRLEERPDVTVSHRGDRVLQVNGVDGTQCRVLGLGSSERTGHLVRSVSL